MFVDAQEVFEGFTRASFPRNRAARSKTAPLASLSPHNRADARMDASTVTKEFGPIRGRAHLKPPFSLLQYCKPPLSPWDSKSSSSPLLDLKLHFTHLQYSKPPLSLLQYSKPPLSLLPH
ncbi:Hypothetical predicted protein [Xyrichtys novacula]|uniref:Uncharacterized protein n=1 Tax=Xyrichtys novacula TaxID=13765 RepID=A0AAV1FJG1_XYRNO|nr:Hypothetical predicted protein [Xyrichtys novacula]